ncbi:hypothetical protein C8A01DRAFT_17080 [Parachaetomium inaequale]|uniref:Uncharacterized protein n=1 Tax=Parachaetomium inaequale TaxID=2588326 RepID=A0AAN6SQZ4_9PEZI|nr:hypothetical protein C8A01DRAFT_17080 [Parachaetomium inaequale]
METIHESRHKTTGMLPEAALFSVVRPNQWTTDVVVSAAMDGLTGRSSSLKMPLTRKTSFRVREWVKRSNSTRTTTATTGMSASGSLKAHIKHLGGGRLDEVEVEGTANNTTLLAPVPKRALRSRASSIESRATQWLDFYTGSPDASKPQGQPLPKPRPSDEQPSQRQRAGSNADLRPAPLRVPSSERAGSAGSPTPTPPPKPLTRKNSKWKPLPNLPAQLAGLGQFEMDTAVTKAAGAERGRESEPATASRSEEKPALEQSDPGFLPIFRFDSPPPTPDSDAGGAARAHVNKDKGKGRSEEGTPPPEPGLDKARAREKIQQNAEAEDSVRHTRQERIWLHVNYRGEAPFLQAWGLDIAKMADRLEGLAILRELIQAEVEERAVEGPQGAVQGSTLI